MCVFGCCKIQQALKRVNLIIPENSISIMEPDDVSPCTICLVALAFTSNQCLIWVLLNHLDVLLQSESSMATPTWLQSLLPIHQWKTLCFYSTKSHLLAAMQKRKDAGTVLAKDTLQHCIQHRLSTGVVFFF